MQVEAVESPWSDQDIAELQGRNAVRLEEAKKRLGQRYLLHPANRVKRQPSQKRRRIRSWGSPVKVTTLALDGQPTILHTDVSELVQQTAGDDPADQFDLMCKLLNSILAQLDPLSAERAVQATFPQLTKVEFP